VDFGFCVCSKLLMFKSAPKVGIDSFRICCDEEMCWYADGLDDSMRMLRKLLAITVLLFLGLPAAVSAFALAPKSDANLPACCRKNGKHHCMMSAAERSRLSDNVQRVSAPVETCPFAPQAVPAGHVVSWFVGREQGALVMVVGRSAGVAQAECLRRISRDRTRQKRGPPTVSLL
jgi:hypothetical protein